ncbi:MAG: hypothetical protein ABIG87_01515 [Patescibacteria group bacterium]
MKQNTKSVLYLIILLPLFYIFVIYLPAQKIDDLEEISKNNSDKNTEILKETDYFARNLDCLKLKNEIEQRIKNKVLGERMTLEQIFYSPKINSCLYVDYLDSGYSEKVSAYHFYQKRLFDVLDDGFSSHPLEGCSVVEVGENCDGFNNKVEEYKK